MNSLPNRRAAAASSRAPGGAGGGVTGGARPGCCALGCCCCCCGCCCCCVLQLQRRARASMSLSHTDVPPSAAGTLSAEIDSWADAVLLDDSAAMAASDGQPVGEHVSVLRQTVSPEDAEVAEVAKTILMKQRQQEEIAKGAEEAAKFETNEEFARHEQSGSRAIGGQKPRDEQLYGQIESADYLTPDTQQEEAYQRTFTPQMRTRRRFFIWGLYACLGVAVTMQIVYVLHACDWILKLRTKPTAKLLAEQDYLGAWLLWTGSSLALCLVACLLVLWQPAAASSGIPGLVAFLNGAVPIGGKSPLTGKMTGFLSFETLLAKTVGMTLSIPSGLCLGPEGPIIHIGALFAHHTTHFFQVLSHKLLPDNFHFSVKGGEERDFLATGAAVGICVAFRAPLAGCLFVVEEAASFFTVEHLEYTFFATIIAYMVALYLSSSDESFTKFKQATGDFCTLYDGFDLVLFVAIAVLGGMSGALFNHIVEELNHWRAHAINKKVWSRVLEVVLLTLATGTVTVFLPALYQCEHPTRSMMMEDSIGCLSEEDAFQISHGSVSHSALSELLKDSSSGSARSAAIQDLLQGYRMPEHYREQEEGGAEWKDKVWIDNADEEKHVHLHYQHAYTCDEGDYNAMSMLWLNGGVKAVKVLLQRGFPHMLNGSVLLVFFAVYFCLAAYTSGVSVPAGLIVPHLLIGGSMGRAFGLIGIAEKKEMCSALKDLAANATLHSGDMYNDPADWLFDDTYVWSTVYRWVGRDCRMPDPGMYAVVGMAAFLSGSGRITLMLATVIIELTDDASLIGPVGVASIIAMIVGNMFNHGLYHGLIPVMNMPYLNNEPADVMHLVRVGDIMARDVICLSKMAKPTDIERLIRQCDIGEVTHHAFPVVDDAIEGKLRGKTLRGLISLDALRTVMHSAGADGSTNKRRRRLMQGSESVVQFEQQQVGDDMIAQLCEWLVHVPLMHDLSRGVLEQIAAGMRRGTVRAGEDIIHVGEPGSAMYFLAAGSADALVRDVSVFSYEESGKFFGELALLTDEPRKATIRAGSEGATVWELDRTIFEETLSLSDRDINLLKYADRSPLTVNPHTKVARAFEVFRKLGMRHLCVSDAENNLVGMVTRKDLMTYKIVDNIMTPRAEAVIRGWVYKFRARKAAEAAEAAATAQGAPNPSPRTVRSMKLGVKVGKWEVNAHIHQQQQQQQQQQRQRQSPASALLLSSPSAVTLMESTREFGAPVPPLTAPPVVRTPRTNDGNSSRIGNKLDATIAPEPTEISVHVADEELLTTLGDARAHP